MKYDVIIIGGGAAGLFCASSASPCTGLILDKSKTTALKLLMSGSGQCNLTHGGDIKEFLNEYGAQGRKIRTILYKYSNLKVMDFFKDAGLPLFIRDDLKVFPKSLKAMDVKNILLSKAQSNGFEINTSVDVTKIQKTENGYIVNEKYECSKLVIATGGASYPITGSDGQIYKVLTNLDLQIVPLKPALVPVFVQDYPYSALAGISFKDINISVVSQIKHTITGDLLLTHTGFSGPAILSLSRYANPGDKLLIDFSNIKDTGTTGNAKLDCSGVSKSIANVLTDKTGLPKRFIGELLSRRNIAESTKASTLAQKTVNSIWGDIREATFSISGTGGYKEAMVTAGGISLNEISPKSMESKKHPGLYLIGEVLDVDGNTGGYNLQFAFSSGYIAAQHISL